MLSLREGLASSPAIASGTSTSGNVSRWRSIQSLRMSAPRLNTAAISASVKLPQASIGVHHAAHGTPTPSGSPSQNQVTASGVSGRRKSGT